MPPKAPSDLDEFGFERVSFEIRFPAAFLHWDRAGAIWNAVARLWPELEIVTGEPGRTSFTVRKKVELTVTLENATVIEHWPQRDLGEFKEMAKEFTKVLIEQLELTTIKRVGLRQFFLSPYPSREEATQAFLATKLIRYPPDAQFGTKGVPLMPEYAVRWEGETLGATVRAKVESRRMEFEPSPKFPKLKPILEETAGIALDLDYFTVAEVSVGKLDVAEWIQVGAHVMRRDIKSYLQA